ncbi:MAG: HDOD domain-containing protein [Vicinamibacteraceae bacterium]|nr:HDOD domain-containing protein [Vicinamibacteraceae bacterium]
MADRAQLRARVEGITKILTIPAIVNRIAAMVSTGTVSASEIADEISKDQILTAKVLKLVNSGFYALRQPITTITHAMVLLGLDVVKTLVMTASVLDIVDTMNQYMEGLWEHSLGTARASHHLAERLGRQDPEEIALAGLLHDIGKVIIAQLLPEDHARIRAMVAERQCLLIDAEQAVLGVTHPEVGMWLLRKWSLPSKIVYPIAYHSNFHARRDFADRTAIVHLADILCRAKGIGYPGDRRMPRLNADAWQLLGLSMDDVAAVCAELDRDVDHDTFA